MLKMKNLKGDILLHPIMVKITVYFANGNPITFFTIRKSSSS